MAAMERASPATAPRDLEDQLERHRRGLAGYCYRMLASPFEAEDAVQETFLRAWRAYDRFEGRAALGSWLYRIATNVCMDMLASRKRRARPMDLGPALEPVASNLNALPETTWIEPIPDSMLDEAGDPADVALARETVRLGFVAALQHLPPRQRAALILCEVLRWKAKEVAELLDMSVGSVNSALQRARATLGSADAGALEAQASGSVIAQPDRDLLARYVEAFEAYDIDRLTALIREDAIQSMPPPPCGLTAARASSAGGMARGSAARARGCCRRRARTGRSPSASTSRARPGRGSTRGRCRWSSSPARASPS